MVAGSSGRVRRIEKQPLVDFVDALEAASNGAGRYTGRDERQDDPYEGDVAASHTIFVVNLGGRPGYLDGVEELATAYTIVDLAPG